MIYIRYSFYRFTYVLLEKQKLKTKTFIKKSSIRKNKIFESQKQEIGSQIANCDLLIRTLDGPTRVLKKIIDTSKKYRLMKMIPKRLIRRKYYKSSSFSMVVNGPQAGSEFVVMLVTITDCIYIRARNNVPNVPDHGDRQS
jgi:hypothetical protein